MGSDRELLNEMKRLQNVITNLDAMIAQQIISNTNLTNMIGQQVQTNTNLVNSIIELQNQVAQQTITNAELQTSVTRLTTITCQLITVNIRALDNTDIPFTSLPYDMERLNRQTNLVNNYTTINQDYTVADWGAGLDFFAFYVVFWVSADQRFMFQFQHGLNVEVLVQPAAEYYSLHTYETRNYAPVQYSATSWIFARTIIFPVGINVLSTDTLRLTFRNATGVQLGQISSRVSGVALAT